MGGRGEWAWRIGTRLDDALRWLRGLFADVLGIGERGWLTTATQELSRPPRRAELRVVMPVWCDPRMVVGSRTFTGDVLPRLGLANVIGTSDERDPWCGQLQLQPSGADLVLLPDEPYALTVDDGPAAFSDLRTVLASGPELTGYGPALASARAHLLRQVRRG